MSFNPESERLINELIIGEYTKAREDWGDTYNSLHEAYAVLLEEIEEAKEYFEYLTQNIELLWLEIRKDFDKKNKKNIFQNCKSTKIICTNTILELAQVGGVLMKTIDTLEVKE